MITSCPNKALENGDIDANYFQHIPYLNKQIADNGYDFVNAGAVHIEPMGLYSKRISDISELAEGATVITSNSESDWGRILTILQDAGVIKLKDGIVSMLKQQHLMILLKIQRN